MLRFALRSLLRRPGTSLIHAGGLAIGIVCCFLALLYVQDEQGYDQFHEDAEQIMLVERGVMFGAQQDWIPSASADVVEALRTNAPGVVAVAPTSVGSGIVRQPDRPEGVRVEDVRFADAGFFDVFTFPLLSGNASSALSEPNQAVLTEALARTLFGTSDVVGERVRVELTGSLDSTALELTVSGITATPPKASTVPFEMLVSGTTSVASSDGLSPALLDGDPAYVRFASLADTSGAHAAISATLAGSDGRAEDRKSTTRFSQLVDQHFRFYSGTGMTGKPMYLTLFSAIAALILLLACINYANLATALAAQRSTEVGVRKALGAGRAQIGIQFLSEALLLAAVAGLAALALTALVLPVFNAFFGKAVALTSIPLSLAAVMVGVVALTGLIAGLYPALVLARFQPARVLSGVATAGKGGTLVRHGLVVVQFTVTSVLLGGTLLIAGQLTSVRQSDLGFRSDQVVVFDLQAQGLQRDALKQALQALPSVGRASRSSATPGGSRTVSAVSPSGTPEDPSDDIQMDFIRSDADFRDALGLRMAAGVWFSEGAADAKVLNETAARDLGLMTTDASEAIGQTVDEGTVVGVVRDFHVSGMREKIQPMLFEPTGDYLSVTELVVQIDAATAGVALADMERAWKTVAPEYPFEPVFLDDQFADQFREDRQLGELFGLFAGIAILLACVGMLGLAAHAAERRTKEFGIRKVLGASVAGLVTRLSREFVVLVGISLALAAPVLVIGARYWLAGFAYPAAVQPGMFVALGLGVLLLSLATVSVHALRVATQDPVRALRSD